MEEGRRITFTPHEMAVAVSQLDGSVRVLVENQMLRNRVLHLEQNLPEPAADDEQFNVDHLLR
jgi:hypothetical protein